MAQRADLCNLLKINIPMKIKHVQKFTIQLTRSELTALELMAERDPAQGAFAVELKQTLRDLRTSLEEYDDVNKIIKR